MKKLRRPAGTLIAVFEFFVPQKPRGKGRPVVTRKGHCFTPQKTVDAEARVREAFKARVTRENKGHLFPWPGPVRIYCAFCYNQDKKHYPGRDVTSHPPHASDGDNTMKLVWDALNHLAYQDDCQIVGWSGEKLYHPKEGTVVLLELYEPTMPPLKKRRNNVTRKAL